MILAASPSWCHILHCSVVGLFPNALILEQNFGRSWRECSGRHRWEASCFTLGILPPEPKYLAAIFGCLSQCDIDLALSGLTFAL